MLPHDRLRRLPRLARLTATAALVAAAAIAAPDAALAADDRPRFVIAVLGDSYAAGEGSPDVPGKHSWLGDLDYPIECAPLPFTPPRCFTETWWSPDAWFAGRDAIFPQQDDPGWQAAARRCHRSSKAPGPQAAMLVADRFPEIRVEVLDFACSGSKIGSGLVDGWPGPEPPPFAADLPPQITALRDYAVATDRRIDATVVNIGGNDGGFAKLVEECLNIVNPFDDCTNNDTLDRIRDQLIPDAAGPAFPHPDAPLSMRYRKLNDVIEAQVNAPARPDELYLTALPNPAHDAPPAGDPGNPQDFCDGTQTSDPWYDNATRGESIAIEGIIGGLNGAMQRAADRHQWTFMPQMFEAWRDHGVCAQGASFFRTNDDALKFQGDEGDIPLPHISPGIAHPNDAGYADRARMVADVLEAHMRMRFRAPVLSLDAVEPDEAFQVSWSDPSPDHLAETRWELKLTAPGLVKVLGSNSLPGRLGFSAPTASSFRWRVPETGEFKVRLRGCRLARTAVTPYCGPYSVPLTVATATPPTPLGLRRAQLLPLDDVGDGLPVRLAWSAAPGTPAGTTYKVQYGRPVLCLPAQGLDSCIGGGGIVSATGTSVRVDVPEPRAWSFRVRACSTAGCSPFSPYITSTVSARKG
jgi:hypothetical protein